MSAKFKDIILLIPAYNPDHKLVDLIVELHLRFETIIIVNDGSKSTALTFFEQAKSYGCLVLEHKENMGQGAAFKTALKYIEAHYSDQKILGAITADADGQHLPKDILRLTEAFENHSTDYFITIRQFTKDIPLRSYIGNKSISFLVKTLFGKYIPDCQSGLRAVPCQYFNVYFSIDENRFNFTIGLLAVLLKKNVPLQFLPIETVYIDNNKSSHFRPVKDSYETLKTLLKYWRK